jgi:O-antigen/teichoic acid export membrane protein
MANYTKKFLVNVGKVFIVSIIAAFIGYIIRIYFARSLTVEEFGLFYSIIAFLAIFVIFITFGLDRALVYFIPKFLAESKPEKIKNSVLYVALVLLVNNIIFIIILSFFARFLGANLFKNEIASTILMLMAVSFFIDTFVLIIQSSFQGFQMMGTFSSINIARMSLILVISFIFFKLGLGILSPVIAYIITPIILILVYSFLLYKKNKNIFSIHKLTWQKPLFKKLYKYGSYMILLTIGGVILGHSDRLMITAYRTLEEVGIYSAVFPTAMLFSYVPYAIGKVLFPITSELWSKGLKVEFRKGVELLYRSYFMVLLPTSFLIFTFSGVLLELFYGAAYASGGFALKILAISAIFLSLSSINGNILSGIGKPKIYTLIIITGTIMNVILNIIFIPKFGISGAAMATGISFALMMFIGYSILVKKKLVTLPYVHWFKTLLISLAFLFIINYLNMNLAMNLFLKIFIILAISGTFYVAALFIFKLITVPEVKELVKRVRA